MNFVHTAHVGAGEMSSDYSSAVSIQDHMKSKGGYTNGTSATVEIQETERRLQPALSFEDPLNWAFIFSKPYYHGVGRVPELKIGQYKLWYSLHNIC